MPAILAFCSWKETIVRGNIGWPKLVKFSQQRIAAGLGLRGSLADAVRVRDVQCVLPTALLYCPSSDPRSRSVLSVTKSLLVGYRYSSSPTGLPLSTAATGRPVRSRN